MTVTKRQLINGTANFMLREVVPAVNDTALKAIIVAGTKLIQQSETAADGFLSNSVVKMFLPEENGAYDFTAAYEAVRSALAECGVFPITIAPIPLIMKEEKTLSFGVADIDNLHKHIQEAAANG